MAVDSRCPLSAAHQTPLIMMTDGCLLGWVSDGKALSYSHFPLVRRQIRFFLLRALHSFSFSYANCDCSELLRHRKLMKCQPGVLCQRTRQMFCLCFFELNQLNEVLHGKCLLLQAELSGTFLQQNCRLYKRFYHLGFGYEGESGGTLFCY